MSMNPTPKERDDETQKAIDEFLAKGGVIQKYKFGERSEKVEYTGGFYGKKKKKVDEGTKE